LYFKGTILFIVELAAVVQSLFFFFQCEEKKSLVKRIDLLYT